jgi:hypothetical protein
LQAEKPFDFVFVYSLLPMGQAMARISLAVEFLLLGEQWSIKQRTRCQEGRAVDCLIGRDARRRRLTLADSDIINSHLFALDV